MTSKRTRTVMLFIASALDSVVQWLRRKARAPQRRRNAQSEAERT